MFKLEMDGGLELEKILRAEATRYDEGREAIPKKAVDVGLREAKKYYSGGFTDGNVLPQLSIVRNSRGDWSLEASGEDLLFLEYGYGIVGAAKPYPEAIDWDYDEGGHGMKGWFYHPKGGDGKKLAWSRGMGGRRGLYHAAQKMADKIFSLVNDRNWR